MQAPNIEATDPRWKPLFRFGAIAALSMVGIIVVQFVVFMTAPPPLEGTAIDWFRLFQQNKFIGLIDFELLMVVYTLLSIPLALALYFALRQTDQAFAALSVALTLVGVVCFVAARPALEMLYLSDQFAAATSEAQKALFLAAGEAKLATFHGTAFQVSYLLGSLNGLVISIVMWRSGLFSKATAYVRLGSSLFDLGLYVPGIGMYLSIFSVFFLFAWNIMVARKLFQLARPAASQVLKASREIPAS